MTARAFISTCLIVAYACLLIQPVFPLLQYQLHKSYIVENVCVQKDEVRNCCQGKCYLKQKITENNDESEQKSYPSISNDLIQLNYLPETSAFQIASVSGSTVLDQKVNAWRDQFKQIPPGHPPCYS